MFNSWNVTSTVRLGFIYKLRTQLAITSGASVQENPRSMHIQSSCEWYMFRSLPSYIWHASGVCMRFFTVRAFCVSRIDHSVECTCRTSNTLTGYISNAELYVNLKMNNTAFDFCNMHGFISLSITSYLYHRVGRLYM